MNSKRTHGGREDKGKRKAVRPLCVKSPMHLVIKCRRKIYPEYKLVDEILKTTARKFGIPVYDYAIALDHIHFVTKVPSREAYVKFIRVLCGLLAMKLGPKLFDSIFTRIADWGHDYFNLIVYCKKNREEAFWNFHFNKNFRYHRPKPA